MIRLPLTEAEAFALLLASESFLAEAPEEAAEALTSASAKLSLTGVASPFRSAAEALTEGFRFPLG